MVMTGEKTQYFSICYLFTQSNDVSLMYKQINKYNIIAGRINH